MTVDVAKARALVNGKPASINDDLYAWASDAADLIYDLLDEVEMLTKQLASFAQGVKIRIPTETMEQEFARQYDRGYLAGKAERDALARDAARYRWLRDQHNNIDPVLSANYDVAIDAAMGEKMDASQRARALRLAECLRIADCTGAKQAADLLRELAAEPEVASVTECEACLTPDVCQLRGTCDHYAAEKLRVSARLAEPERVPVKYGCHCDLDPDQEPDGCVLDYDAPSDCRVAMDLVKHSKKREDCEYWKPITLHGIV